jgi:hypothetical protein
MTMPKPLPKSFVRTDEEDILEKAEDTRGMSDEQRWRAMRGLCKLAAELVAQHPDPQKTLDFQEPVPDGSLRIFARLRERQTKDTRG